MEPQVRLPLIGEKAPSFKAESTQGPIHFPDDYKGKWFSSPIRLILRRSVPLSS